ncbi:MAG: hypothetical protein LQ346_003110 [Caloplaca aetnensis]|nr:MAG: hypothetical protein LQ346_003110 [Caloplaca aetnensis]
MSTMFGALNRFISRLDSESASQSSRDRSAYGFQVLRNKNPEIPLEPWYDIVVGLNNRQLDSADPNLFATEVRNCAGSSVSLTVWSAKGSRSRILTLPIPTPSPTLGLTLQWTPLSVTEDVWHVLDVIANSPADNAGLLPYGDYIVGTPEGNVHGESGLGELVEDYLGRSLRLYVYNHEYAVTRLVTLTPSRSWGGSGALGCVLGFGALHRLPAPMEEPIAAADGTVFEAARFSNEEHRPSSTKTPMQSSALYPPPASATQSSHMLEPAAMTSPPPLPPQSATTPGPPKGTTRRPRTAAASNMTFDEYFREGEQKSKEEDFAPSAKSAAPPPPPPPKSAKAPPPPKSPEPVVETETENERDETTAAEPGSEPETEPDPENTDG